MILSNDCWLTDAEKLRCRRYVSGDCNDGEFCEKLFRLNSLYEQSNLPKNKRRRMDLRIDSDGTDRDKFIQLSDIEKNILSFVKEGKNLYLYSKICGNGKTEWSIRLLQSYFNQIWHMTDFGCHGLFLSVPSFFKYMKDNLFEGKDNNLYKNAENCELVVWDEIAIKTLTNYEHETLLNLLSSRISKGLSNIYTSNMNPSELNEKLGERLYSRVINTSMLIQLNGKDKRGVC